MSAIFSSRSEKNVRAPRHRGLMALVGLLVALVLLPIISLVWIALQGSGEDLAHVTTTVLPDALKTTLLLMALVTVFTASIGVTTAWLVSTFDFPFRRVLAWLVILPIAIPPYLAAYSFVEFFHFAGPVQGAIRTLFGFASRNDYWFPDIRSVWGAGFMLGLVLYPYVYLSTRVVFLMQGRNAADVARSLGAGQSRVFFKVLLPMARPAIIAGVALALMETLNDIGAVEYLGVRTLAFSVFNTWLARGSLEGAAQLALIMMVIVVFLLWLEAHSRRMQRFVSGRTSQVASRPGRALLRGWKGWLGTASATLPVLAGFSIPVYVLGGFALKRLDQIADTALHQAILNSILVGVATAVMTVSLSLFLLHAGRQLSHKGKLAIRAASSGYAIPGTVLALGLLYILTGIDGLINTIARTVSGASVGLIVTGSAFAIILAATIRFLAVSESALASALHKLPPNLDAAARNLGRTPVQAGLQVLFPLLRPAMITSMVLVFVDTVKELSSAILLRPIGFNTLATLVYENASRAAVEDAAVAALAIVFVSLVPVLILAKALAQDKRT